MNIKHFDILDKIHYYLALLLFFYTVVYATNISTATTTPMSDDGVCPFIVTILIMVVAYVFLTIVNSDKIIELAFGLVSIACLTAIVPIIGVQYDPNAITAQYFRNIIVFINCGIVYIFTYKIFKIFHNRLNK